MKAITKERIEHLQKAQHKIKECVALIHKAVEGTAIEERVRAKLIAKLMSYVDQPQNDCASIEELIKEVSKEG